MYATREVKKQIRETRWPTHAARAKRRGAAVVELAITVPLLGLLILGVVEYAQLTNAAQVVSNASRRGALYAATNEITSTTAVESYVREFITGSFANLSAGQGSLAVSVNVLNTAGMAIANGDLSTLSSGTPVVVDVSLDFDSIRLISHFGLLNQATLQTSTVARRE